MRMWRLGPALGLATAILVVSHLPKGVLPPTGLHYRIEHALAYGSLAAACLYAMRKRPALARVAITLGLVVMVGAMDELTQPLFGRQCSALDWLADLVGAGLAVGLWLPFHRWRRGATAGSPRPHPVGEERNAPRS